MLVSGVEPTTYNRAIRAPDGELWREAINAELDALHPNNTWEVIPYPKGWKIVDCKWVFKYKLAANGDIARQKARLIAKGYIQVKGTDYNETYAPVASYDSLRFLLAIATHDG